VRIECGRCEMYESEHCADCLVTALLHPPAGAIEIDDELDSSLQALSGAGLIPVLKFRARGQRTPPGDASARAG
jgi:hypothetical protein